MMMTISKFRYNLSPLIRNCVLHPRIYAPFSASAAAAVGTKISSHILINDIPSSLTPKEVVKYLDQYIIGQVVILNVVFAILILYRLMRKKPLL
jgi:hypothetical protein